MNVNEYGLIFRLSSGFDMSAFTALSLTFTKPDKTILTVTNAGGVAVGSVDVVTTLGTFLAHKYVNYTFLTGNVDQAGLWSVRLTYTDASPLHLISDVATFTVNP